LLDKPSLFPVYFPEKTFAQQVSGLVKENIADRGVSCHQCLQNTNGAGSFQNQDEERPPYDTSKRSSVYYNCRVYILQVHPGKNGCGSFPVCMPRS